MKEGRGCVPWEPVGNGCARGGVTERTQIGGRRSKGRRGGVLGTMGPELGFNTSEALEEPIGADEGIDEKTLERVPGWCEFRRFASTSGEVDISFPIPE